MMEMQMTTDFSHKMTDLFKRIVWGSLMVATLVAPTAWAAPAGKAVSTAVQAKRSIYRYARSGDVKALQKLVQRGVSLETVDGNGNTALCSSVMFKDVRAYNTLLQAGADLSAPCMDELSDETKARFCGGVGIADRSICPQAGVAATGMSPSAMALNALGVGALGAAAIVAVAGGGGGGGGGSGPSATCSSSSDCNDHGSCTDGKCICDSGYLGPHCEIADTCVGVDCGEHGSCMLGVCKCDPGWMGAHCSEIDQCYDVDCGSHGSCNNGVCLCEDGYSGPNCEIEPNLCYDSTTKMQKNCGPHGTCDENTGKCVCDEGSGYTGEYCEKAPPTPVPEVVSLSVIDADEDASECSPGKIINGVCTMQQSSVALTPDTDGNFTAESASLKPGDPDALANVAYLAEFGGSVSYDDQSTPLAVTGDTANPMIGLWANGVATGAVNTGVIDLSKASTAINTGTIDAVETATTQKGVIAMRATSDGYIRNDGTINVTSVSTSPSAAMDVSRNIKVTVVNQGGNVQNNGVINITASEDAHDVKSVFAPDRQVVNGPTSEINLKLGKSTLTGTAAQRGIVSGLTGNLAVNRGTISLKADDSVSPGDKTAFVNTRLLEASANGKAVNDGILNLDMTNLMYSVYGIYPNSGAKGTKAINAGTINVSGKLYNDEDISKQVFLIGSGDGSATLLNEGVINVGRDLTEEEIAAGYGTTDFYFDVSDGGHFYVVYGDDGTATNDQIIKFRLVSSKTLDAFHVSGLNMQKGTIVNNGTIDAILAGKTSTASDYAALDAHSMSPSQTNKGIIRVNSSVDGSTIVGIRGNGSKTNASTGAIYLTTSGKNSDLIAVSGENIEGSSNSAHNEGIVSLTHDGGSGDIVGYGGGNTGSIRINANGMTEYSHIYGGLTAGGVQQDDSKGQIKISLSGSTYGEVYGYVYDGSGNHALANLLELNAVDPARAGNLYVTGFTNHYGATPAKNGTLTRNGDTRMYVNGVPGAATYIWGMRGLDQNQTHTGAMKIIADLTGSTAHQVIGMETIDSTPTEGRKQYKAINTNSIYIHVDGPDGSAGRTDVVGATGRLSGMPFDVIGMATNSYAENRGTITLEVSGGAKTAGLVAYDGGQIVNSGTIIFSGNAADFTPLYGTGSRDVVVSRAKVGDVSNVVTKKETVYATISNSGTILINNIKENENIASGTGFESGSWARYVYNLNTQTGGSGTEYNYLYDKYQHEQYLAGLFPTDVAVESTISGGWIDTITHGPMPEPENSSTPTPTPPTVLGAGVVYIAELQGVFASPGSHILGDVTAGTTIVQDGYLNEYINDGLGFGALIGDGDATDLGLTSGSALFSASYRRNLFNQDGLDIVMTRRAFGDVLDDDSLADFLEYNYQKGNNEAFFNQLKNFGDVSDLTAGLNSLTGKEMLSRFNFEDMTMMRELNFDMNEKLFHNKEQSFALAGMIEPMAFRGDIGSNSRYSLFNKRKGKVSVGLGIAFTETRSDDGHNRNDRNDTMYQMIMPIGYRVGGFNLMTSPRIGYARGTYDRTGFNSESYDGHLEKRVFGLMNEARYPITVGSWLIEPSAELNVLGYKQRGHEDAKEYALNIKSQDTYSVESGIGLYLTRAQELSRDRRLKLMAGVAAYHEFANPYELRIGMTGMDGTFTLRDEKRSDNRAVLRAGFDYDTQDYSLYGSVISFIDREIRTSLSSGIKWKF